MMKATETPRNAELMASIVAILGSLGPFDPEGPREAKWRTTEQLANAVSEQLEHAVTVDMVDALLTAHEAEGMLRLNAGLPADRDVRRATYPDRTTVLPLWGSTVHHGQPWLGQPSAILADRSDAEGSAASPNCDAPVAFLSYSSRDARLAANVAERLTLAGLRTWRYEASILPGENIARAVREALVGARWFFALLTRTSIASLWVLSELHTALMAAKAIRLIVDAEDATLTRLLQSGAFPHVPALPLTPVTATAFPLDMSVEYDLACVDEMYASYAELESATRTARYRVRVHEFLATLPAYVSGQPLIMYPAPPQMWRGPLPTLSIQDIRNDASGT
jgi:hypothetical protein